MFLKNRLVICTLQYVLSRKIEDQFVYIDCFITDSYKNDTLYYLNLTHENMMSFNMT